MMKTLNMLEKTMKFLRYILVITISLLPAVAQAAPITKKEVREMLAAMDAAVLAEDMNKFGDYLSEDIQMVVDLQNQGNIYRRTMGKQDFLTALYQSIIRLDAYDLTRENIKIKVKSPTTVAVTSRLIETIIVGDRQSTGVTQDNFIIERVGDSLLVTAYSSKTRM